jgi:uncharacterized membrane protein YeaQ/YmgE (transglycosylase-associated protein family)
MHFLDETILFIVLGGVAVGLLPSTFVNRTGFRLVGDIIVGIAGVTVATWLTLAWRDLVPLTNDLLASKPGENISEDQGPNYEPVVLPLATLRPLLKPVIYRSREEVCTTLIQAARTNDLPTHFFIRLLYQESNFRPAAISSAGALGIAQFMPETATDRRLDNPFDPLQAIPASARLLRDLYQKFGNLGLAAAAYNAGPKRIMDWRANGGQLPQETQDYVKAITGWPAESWSEPQAGSPALKLPRAAPCQEAAGLLAWNGPEQIPLPLPNRRAQESADQAKAAAPSTAVPAKRLHSSGQAKRGQRAKAVSLAGN